MKTYLLNGKLSILSRGSSTLRQLCKLMHQRSYASLRRLLLRTAIITRQPVS